MQLVVCEWCRQVRHRFPNMPSVMTCTECETLISDAKAAHAMLTERAAWIDDICPQVLGFLRECELAILGNPTKGLTPGTLAEVLRCRLDLMLLRL